MRVWGLRVWETVFRVSSFGCGFEAPSGASAGEASVGVCAVRVLVAVVLVVEALVVITPEAIAIPPAPRTESTVLRNAFISGPAALRGGGGGSSHSWGCWRNLPQPSERGWVPGRRLDWGCFSKGTQERFLRGTTFCALVLGRPA